MICTLLPALSGCLRKTALTSFLIFGSSNSMPCSVRYLHASSKLETLTATWHSDWIGSFITSILPCCEFRKKDDVPSVFLKPKTSAYQSASWSAVAVFDG